MLEKMKIERKIRICFFAIILYIVICVFNSKVYAATFNVSTSKTILNIGEKATISVSSDCTGRVNLSTSSGTLENSKVWVENNTVTTTVTSNSSGKITITATPEENSLSDNGGKDISVGSKSITIEFVNKNTDDTTNNTNTTNTTTSNNNDANTNTSNKNNTSNNTTSTSNGNTGSTTSTKPSTPSNETTTFSSTNETVYTNSKVNLRKDYGTNSSIAMTLAVGVELTRTGNSTSKVNGYNWSKVIYNGATYYCISRSLTTTKPETEENNQENTINNETTDDTANEQNNETNGETEQKNNDAVLTNLKIEGYTLAPNFSPEIYEYTLNISSDVSELNIQTVAANDKVEIEMAGNTNLQDGENIVTVIAHNKETGNATTYQIIVNKETVDLTKVNAMMEASKKKKQIEKIFIIISIILIIGCIILYKINKKDLQEEIEEKEDEKEQNNFQIEEKQKQVKINNKAKKRESDVSIQRQIKSKSEPLEEKKSNKENVKKDLERSRKLLDEKEKVMSMQTNIKNSRNSDFEEKLEMIKKKQNRDKRGKHF